MVKVSGEDLKSIAPYNDGEMVVALQRVFAHPAVALIAKEFFPGAPVELLHEKAKQIKTVRDFQTQFIDTLLNGIEKRSTAGITLAGVEGIAKDSSFLYISNHRDIILDSALFTDMLFRHGFSTPQICLGDNLLTDRLVVDLVKMNKGITVRRGLPPRELLRWSYVLSTWIRQVITQRTDSVWIAQHEGRCKDGNDLTHPGVIKMLAMSGDGGLVQNLRALHIVPVAVSYEFDPSDVEKAYELHLKEKFGSYQKKPKEDQAAMVRGLRDPKGGVFIQVGKEINDVLDKAEKLPLKAEQVRYISAEIDARIHSQYRNFSSNYIACDLLGATEKYRDKYTDSQREYFVQRLSQRLDSQGVPAGDRESVKMRVLHMYAMSVRNAEL